MTLTLLQRLDDMQMTSRKTVDRLVALVASGVNEDGTPLTDEQKESATRHANYHSGIATGYAEARSYAKHELQRLCGLHQNGALTYSDFGVQL